MSSQEILEVLKVGLKIHPNIHRPEKLKRMKKI